MENVKDSENQDLLSCHKKAYDSLNENMQKHFMSFNRYEWIRSTLIPTADEINFLENW